MEASIPTQIAETIQTAHIQRNPSPHHDLNPSTAASAKVPVSLHSKDVYSDDDIDAFSDEELVVGHDDDDDDDDDDIPLSVLQPKARRTEFPPMPDLRFEQSYLSSISKAQSWQGIAWITFRDQMIMPFTQGIAYNLAICGWQHWNRTAQISGGSYGARLRRWWYQVNNWPMPKDPKNKR
ncbi:ATG43 family protein [Microdochium nivale]|nr:ATG43 family protein [Microdochium nivale]